MGLAEEIAEAIRLSMPEDNGPLGAALVRELAKREKARAAQSADLERPIE